jgi:hypothetical protein
MSFLSSQFVINVSIIGTGFKAIPFPLVPCYKFFIAMLADFFNSNIRTHDY